MARAEPSPCCLPARVKDVRCIDGLALACPLRRSLKPGVHYVPYWNATGHDYPDDILSVVDQLEQIDRDDPAALQRVVSNAMSFSAK